MELPNILKIAGTRSSTPENSVSWPVTKTNIGKRTAKTKLPIGGPAIVNTTTVANAGRMYSENL